ncbi:hypothetical protein TNCV_1201601 [Trichonephila clavipes]|nr:hypothetical protein TNCV_1201601 [Trichonephila clavipes]
MAYYGTTHQNVIICSSVDWKTLGDFLGLDRSASTIYSAITDDRTRPKKSQRVFLSMGEQFIELKLLCARERMRNLPSFVLGGKSNGCSLLPHPPESWPW